MKYKVIEIKKPMYETKGDYYLTIRTEKLESAIKYKQMVKLVIPELGSYWLNPDKWIKTGKVADQVFLRPDEPLRLTGNYLSRTEKIVEKTEEILSPLAVMASHIDKNKEEWRKLGAKLHS